MESNSAPKVSSSLDIIKNEKIGYNNHITIDSKELTEVYHYSREFVTFFDYKLLTIKLSIPFTGNGIDSARSRVILYLDDEELCDGSMYNTYRWEFKLLHLEGIGVNIKAGNHKLKLKYCVDSGVLYIPHFLTSGIENTVKPSIFGKLIIIGQN